MKTANNKIPVSSIFNDSEGLHGTTVCHCFVRRPHYSARLMRFGSRVWASSPPKCLDRNCVGRRRTGARHGNVYRSVREKQGIVTRNCCLSAMCLTNSDISACCFTGISRARPPENRKYQSPPRSQIFANQKISSPRERRKRSLDLGQHLKGASLWRSHSNREIKNATTGEFSTFLKVNKSREQILLG